MKTLEKWIGYSFDNADYSETGYDEKAVKRFRLNLNNFIKKNVNGVKQTYIHSGYYNISGFIKGKSKIVYISLPDFRDKDAWVDRILIRTAEDVKDFTGGRNKYTSLKNLRKDIESIIN